jgi:putative oxidoreductase
VSAPARRHIVRRYARLKPQAIFLAVHRVEFHGLLPAAGAAGISSAGRLSVKAGRSARRWMLRWIADLELHKRSRPGLRIGRNWAGFAARPQPIWETLMQIQKLYEMFVRAASSLESPFLLIVRLYWGWQFMQTGWGKVGRPRQSDELFHQPRDSSARLERLFHFGLEFAGGILLAIGLGSRLIAFLLAADMAVAYYLGDHDALLSFFSDPDKFYAAAPFTFLIASLIVLIFGPGKLALDAIIAKRLRAADASGSRNQACSASGFSFNSTTVSFAGFDGHHQQLAIASILRHVDQDRFRGPAPAQTAPSVIRRADCLRDIKSCA